MKWSGRTKQRGSTLVEVASAAFCVGILGAATIGGTTASRTRLQESIHNRMAVTLAQSELEKAKALAANGTLQRGTYTISGWLGMSEETAATTTVRITGPDEPRLMALDLSEINGNTTVEPEDFERSRQTFLRVLSNRDLTQFIDNAGAQNLDFTIEFAANLRDNSAQNDSVPEIIISEAGLNSGFKLQVVDENGNDIGNEFIVNPNSSGMFVSTSPRGYLRDSFGRELGICGIDLSRRFGVNEAKYLRVTTLNGGPSQGDGQPDFKFFGLDTTSLSGSPTNPQYIVSGPGTENGGRGSVILQGVRFRDGQATSALVYAKDVKNVTGNVNPNQLRFLIRPSVVWDVMVDVTYNARTLSGTRPRTITLDSAVTYGSPYF